MICCDEYYELGCYTHCDCVYLTDIFADQAGTWQVLYSYPGSPAVRVIELLDLEVGDAIALGPRFNHNSRIFLRLRRPDLTYFSLNDFECFKLNYYTQIYEGSLTRNQLCFIDPPKETCVCNYTLEFEAVESASAYCSYFTAGCFALRATLNHICTDDIVFRLYINNKVYTIPNSGTVYIDGMFHKEYDYRVEMSSDVCAKNFTDSVLDLTDYTVTLMAP